MFTDLITQAIRVAATTVAGALFTWLATSGYETDTTALVPVLVAVFSVGYAAGVRILVTYVHPAFGVLQVIPTQPGYAAPEVTKKAA